METLISKVREEEERGGEKERGREGERERERERKREREREREREGGRVRERVEWMYSYENSHSGTCKLVLYATSGVGPSWTCLRALRW